MSYQERILYQHVPHRNYEHCLQLIAYVVVVLLRSYIFAANEWMDAMMYDKCKYRSSLIRFNIASV
jgi:hypothetical protein